jgi:serine/threonine-protein kinase
MMRDPVVGDQIDQYQLTELLARSGMASIFKAIDGDGGAVVALKIPHVQFESDVVFFERFRREEEICQQLDHPNIVKVFTPREKTRMYIAMEFVEGRSLRAMLKERQPVATDLALDFARQTCDALVYLHKKGVFHRDIKPENILVTAAGKVKILDFGIALFESARRLTWAGLSNAVGTPDYMAPEQIRGRRGDSRTDVYALGTMLYEMLTCHLPYDGSNARALLRSKVSEEARPPSYYVPGFDPSLEAIIMKAVARSPRDRYETAAAMLADLRNPSTVPPWDPAAAAATGGRGLRLPRRLVVGTLTAAVICGLMALVWCSHRLSAPAGPAPASVRYR